MLERRRPGQGARGGTPSHCLGCRIEQQKINKYKIHRGLKWPLVNDFKCNNQPKIGGRDGEVYGGEVQQAGGAGEVHIHCFGGVGR